MGGPKGDTGPTGPDGSDGIGLHLRVFKIGNTYSPGEYVFHSAPNEKHNAMFVAQQNFVAKDVPAKELDHWVELSKGEKGEKGETGATGATGNSSIIEKRMQRNVKPLINETAIEEVITAALSWSPVESLATSLKALTLPSPLDATYSQVPFLALYGYSDSSISGAVSMYLK